MVRVHIITQGCSANHADSEIMAGHLAQEHVLVKTPEEADLVLFNTCTVKGPTESFFRKKLKELKDQNKKVVLAGCIPQSQTASADYEGYSLVGTEQVHNVCQVVSKTMSGDSLVLLERDKTIRLNKPKIRMNPFVEIVPISQGCLSACTYCKTKHARGALVSTPPSDIVRHISNAVSEGVKEVWITSQDISAYGLDIGTNIAELLHHIVTIDRDFKIRVGMGNPLFILDFLDDYVEVFKHPKIYKFMHLPVQCGNNDVLKDMKRDYTVEDFTEIVNRFRKEIPQFCLSTDVICGFPTENKEQFEDTVQLIKEIKPEVINISRFWPREGTPAARMKQLDGVEINRRSKIMTTVYHEVALEQNKKWIGWKGTVLITEKAKHSGFIGRNFAYKQIIVPGEDLMGKEVEVEIIDATSFDLRSRRI